MGELVGKVSLNSKITCMTQNPYNAMIVTGHTNGTVSMITPRDKSKEPTVTMKCHAAQVTHIEVDRSGHYMVTIGDDLQVKVWEIKKNFELVNSLKIGANAPSATSISISAKGLVAISFGNTVYVWKSAV